MNTVDEVADLIQQLPEPQQRDLLAWMTESLDNRRALALALARPPAVRRGYGLGSTWSTSSCSRRSPRYSLTSSR